ncbi:AMP-binding protein [Rhodopila sp.]|uniref:AMP-binding protein n=1 Tax=Rhodopila sp. TaxID=2480087 RepID=UPI003D105E91
MTNAWRDATTVLSLLRRAAERAPDAEAVVCGPLRLTYRDYHRAVAGFARDLRRLGASDTRVALLCGNSIEAAVATLAIQAAGAVFCPMNPTYTERELRQILTDCRPLIAVCDTACASLVRRLAQQAAIAHVVVLDGDTVTWLSRWPVETALLLPDPDALGMIQYTGGTTGRPKGVMLTHRAIAANVAQREAWLPTRNGDRFLCMMPLFHSFALAMNLYQALVCAGAIVILPRYRPDWVVAELGRERITVLPAGATVFTGLLDYDGLAGADLRHLRACYSGASALPADVLRRWQATTGVPIHEGYGQTEAGPILTYNSLHSPLKPGRVGLPLPGTEVQVVDVSSGIPLPTPDESGEIRARGPQIMLGYWNQPEQTAAALRDGWLYTGDIGAFDTDGHLAILDRRKDMVITGGYNVYPREVDEVLLMHPAVQEAASFGVPDAYRGEVLHAHVVLRHPIPTDELLGHCRTNLARYKVPVVLSVVAAIPKTTVGKIDKAALKRPIVS